MEAGKIKQNYACITIRKGRGHSPDVSVGQSWAGVEMV